MKKYYVAISLNGNILAIISDIVLNSNKYKELNEVTISECEKQAKKTELVVNIHNTTSRYIYNSVRNEFDCLYSSSGTNMGTNDWGFSR
jgi:hypothetical protein